MVGRFEYLDAAGCRHARETRSKLVITITDETLRRLSKGSRFPQLLCSPSVGGIACDAHMDHSSRVQFDDEEGKERAKEEVGDWQKVTGPNLLRMSAQEGCPGLTRWRE